jgi:hemerythrin superfamily protein
LTLENTTEKEVELRKQLLPHFTRILYAHHVAEEETFSSDGETKRAEGHGT